MRGDEAALAGRVRTEIQELMWVVERVEQLLAKANERQDDDYLDGADRDGLVVHMQRAIRLGATKEELFEVLEAALVPGGAPAFHRGLNALLDIE